MIFQMKKIAFQINLMTQLLLATSLLIQNQMVVELLQNKINQTHQIRLFRRNQIQHQTNQMNQHQL